MLSNLPVFRDFSVTKKKAAGVDARGVDESKINDDHAMGTPRRGIMDIMVRFCKSFCLFIRSALSIVFSSLIPQGITRVNNVKRGGA